jgi:hypothetical protein
MSNISCTNGIIVRNPFKMKGYNEKYLTMAYVQCNSPPFTKKGGDARSRKASLGYYAKVFKKAVVKELWLVAV